MIDAARRKRMSMRSYEYDGYEWRIKQNWNESQRNTRKKRDRRYLPQMIEKYLIRFARLSFIIVPNVNWGMADQPSVRKSFGMKVKAGRKKMSIKAIHDNFMGFIQSIVASLLSRKEVTWRILDNFPLKRALQHACTKIPLQNPL